MSKRFAVVLFALLTGVAFAQSKEFWVVKEYKQWSEKECRKMLESSPWASDFTMKESSIESLQTGTQNQRIAPNMVIGYQVQLRSAIPVRQAVARLQMLAENYDQMAPEKKQGIEARIEKFLTTSFADTVLVHVTYKSNVPDNDRDLSRYWQTQTIETLKLSTFLNASGGQRVPLQNFVAAKGAGREFQLIFPRQMNGKPILSDKDKSLKVEFVHPKIGTLPEARVLMDFRVEKMSVNGSLIF